jgi:hypothetical protein
MNTDHWTAKKMMYYAGYLINYRHRNNIIKKGQPDDLRVI